MIAVGHGIAGNVALLKVTIQEKESERQLYSFDINVIWLALISGELSLVIGDKRVRTAMKSLETHRW